MQQIQYPRQNCHGHGRHLNGLIRVFVSRSFNAFSSSFLTQIQYLAHECQ